MMIGSISVMSPSLSGKRTRRHPPVLTAVEIKPFPKEKECCYQEKAGKRLAPTKQMSSMLLFWGGRGMLLFIISDICSRKQVSFYNLGKVKTRIWLLKVFLTFHQRTFQKLRMLAIPANDTSFVMFFDCYFNLRWNFMCQEFGKQLFSHKLPSIPVNHF